MLLKDTKLKSKKKMCNQKLLHGKNRKKEFFLHQKWLIKTLYLLKLVITSECYIKTVI